MHARPDARQDSGSRHGFTLLELIVAVTILAGFVLPILHILTDSRVRSIRTTLQRQMRDLAQQKLHDRIHYAIYEDGTVCDQNEGNFEREGRPNWTWIIEPPEMRSQGEQILLEYTITVNVPFSLDSGGTGGETGSTSESGRGSDYTYTAWTFPSESWYEEQDLLYQNGQPTLLYGDPNAIGGFGAGFGAGGTSGF